ncbi:MAG TPA: enterotoxin A family protein, partial [Streptosporangiaceae bacterium]|nr:enterotoxin A family protein [Streptosporangiaceae bacterium]
STYSASYLHWLHGQGVLTGASSWFGAGAGTTDFTTAMLGSMAGGPETAATSITDLAPEDAGAAAGAARTLFRADTRGPADIFSQGFAPKGSSMNLLEHATVNPADSGFVSTTHSLGSAQDFAATIRADFIYKLRGSGLDVNAELGAASPYPWENEIAVPRSIPGSSIEGAWGPGGWIDNPGFRP